MEYSFRELLELHEELNQFSVKARSSAAAGLSRGLLGMSPKALCRIAAIASVVAGFLYELVMDTGANHIVKLPGKWNIIRWARLGWKLIPDLIAASRKCDG